MAKKTIVTDKALDFYSDGNYNRDLWFEVAAKDYAVLIKELDNKDILNPAQQKIKILDVGCGTGKFPQMLRDMISPMPAINYDLLDPSEYSLAQARAVLKAPMEAGTSFVNIAEDVCADGFFNDSQIYDIIWGMHSFYYIDLERAKDVLRVLASRLKDQNSRLYVYLATKNSTYHASGKFACVFNPDIPPRTYTMAEDIIDVLNIANLEFKKTLFTFNHVINQANHAVLENYLGQCVLNTKLTLEDWVQNEQASQWLADHCKDNVYCFPQEVYLLEIFKT